MVGGGEWLVTRVGVGLGGSGGELRPGMGAGNDVRVSNAISACVAGSAGIAGRDGGGSDVPAEGDRWWWFDTGGLPIRQAQGTCIMKRWSAGTDGLCALSVKRSSDCGREVMDGDGLGAEGCEMGVVGAGEGEDGFGLG